MATEDQKKAPTINCCAVTTVQGCAFCFELHLYQKKQTQRVTVKKPCFNTFLCMSLVKTKDQISPNFCRPQARHCRETRCHTKNLRVATQPRAAAEFSPAHGVYAGITPRSGGAQGTASLGRRQCAPTDCQRHFKARLGAASSCCP